MKPLQTLILVFVFSICYQSTNIKAQVVWISATTSADWQPRFHHTSVVFENKMWILGGENDGEQLNDVWYSYDGKELDSGNERCIMVKTVCSSGSFYSEKMWLMGGCTMFPSTHLNDVWYSTDGNVWNLAARSSEWSARKSFSVLDYKNHMLIIGGDTTAYKFGTQDVWYFK